MRAIARLVPIIAMVALATVACSSDDSSGGEEGQGQELPTPEGTPPPVGSGDPDPERAGRWVTDDGTLVLELTEDGRYSEDMNGQEDAFQGDWTVERDYISLVDDSGYQALGWFSDEDTLLLGETLLERED
ncbi:Atu4866 domain-containing protein [Streptomyces sp. DSM 44917]|uniref:Atu4866 domain-containing protein n=1 Tax=Streptomyces boetiae TaxID=3075541 RepID=A0ABU2L5U7_9ACTN|nr:Atu4866 domain-containing protein [Streptomyces sp. DSM 44917]MDT0306688.1 Atu4866 domain-containing protein [Streptomyces sp. DSM 44917]